MKHKIVLLCFVLGLIAFSKVYSQEEELKDVEYKAIAAGTDSPIAELQIVCFNKHFNRGYLPPYFREKYNLDDNRLYKKKMLIQIFHSDQNKNGFDKIELVGIKENDNTLVVEYNLVNSNTENDKNGLSPFLIVQVPKSKKEIKFIVDEIESDISTKLYLD